MLIQNEVDVLLMSPARNRTTDGTGFLLEISHSQQAAGRTGRIILFVCFGPVHGAGVVGCWFAGRPLQTPEMTFRQRTPLQKSRNIQDKDQLQIAVKPASKLRSIRDPSGG